MIDLDKFIIAPPDLPSEEEMLAERKSRYAWTSTHLLAPDEIRTRQAGGSPSRFNLLSLPAWLALAERADVPFVSARPLADMETEVFIDALDGKVDGALSEFETAVIAGLRPGETLRMEQVAPRETKAELSCGRPIGDGLIDLHDGSRGLDLCEERFADTLFDLGSDRIRAFARPILTPRRIEGSWNGTDGSWPAEFRVFVENFHVVGVSNYYPQVAMDPKVFAPLARQATRLAHRMLEEMHRLHLGIGNVRLAPDRGADNPLSAAHPDWAPETWADQDFTLDFMVLDTGEVVFLEGGPAGLRLAHPCCFLQKGRPIDDGFLHGAAFSAAGPILSLAELGEMTDGTRGTF